MADRFDRFTERARMVLTLAQEKAQRFNHNYIGTEHLLLGLVREGEGIAPNEWERLQGEMRTAISARLHPRWHRRVPVCPLRLGGARGTSVRGDGQA